MKKTLGYTSGTAKSTHGCPSEGEVGGGWIERNKKATNSTHRQTLYRPPQHQRPPVTEERTFPHHPYEDIPMQRPLPELSSLPATRTGKASTSSKREKDAESDHIPCSLSGSHAMERSMEGSLRGFVLEK